MDRKEWEPKNTYDTEPQFLNGVVFNLPPAPLPFAELKLESFKAQPAFAGFGANLEGKLPSFTSPRSDDGPSDDAGP